MTKLSVKLKNDTGLHARPASLLIKCVQSFSSDIKIINNGNEYNAKSMMSILSMGATKGESLDFEINGQDEKDAKEAIYELINSGFKE